LAKLHGEAENAAARLLDAPPEDVILVPPHTIPKTSSGKLRRKTARELFERNQLAVRPQPVWRQLVRLAMAGIGPQLRHLTRTSGEWVYAAWWWCVVMALGGLVWPVIVLLPRATWRWALMHFAARLGLGLMGIPLETIGKITPLRGSIVVSTHASYLDGLVLSAVLPGELAIVAKKELESQFFAGRFLKALGTLFVDRFDPEGGVEDTRRALAAAEKGKVLVFLPEGTFTRAPGLLHFRLGAFLIAAQGRLSVIPLTLRGTRSVLRGEQWFPRRGAVSVRIDKPIFADGTDFSAAVRLRDKVRAAILAACSEPDVDEATQ
jgi:1-acyl-sn-glycerol-3-phosphate acyltransferase